MCRVEFNYRQGAIFRFRKQPLEGGQSAYTHSIQHFWLCANCARIYRLELKHGRLLLRRFSGTTMQTEERSFDSSEAVELSNIGGLQSRVPVTADTALRKVVE